MDGAPVATTEGRVSTDLQKPVGHFPLLQASGPRHLVSDQAFFLIFWSGNPSSLLIVTAFNVAGAPAWKWRVDPDGSPYQLTIDLLDIGEKAATLVARDGQTIPVEEWSGDADFRVLPAQDWQFCGHDRVVGDVEPRYVEQCYHHPAILRRHYQRPHHMTSYGSAGKPSVLQESLHQARVRQLRRFLKTFAPAAQIVVDVGSGQSLVRMATDGRHDFRLVCTDGDREALVFVRNADDNNVVIEATPEYLPLKSGAADFVYAGEVIEHVPDPVVSLRDWARVLKPEGYLVVTTPQVSHLVNRMQRLEVKENKEHLYEWTWGELLQLVCDAGFQPVHHEGLYVPLLGHDARRGGWHDRLGWTDHNRWTAKLGWLASEAGRIPKIGKRVAKNQAIVLRKDGS